jgi:hypothetical protein
MHPHRSLLVPVLALLVIALLSVFATAQQPPDNDTTRQELRSFDQFLDSHPQIAADLQKNPNLVNDPGYVNAHPQLKDFLEDHPRVREEVKENPSAFMNRERRYEQHETGDQRPPATTTRDNDTTRSELRSFDQFLDQDAAVAKELRSNPNLVNDPHYLSSHPKLREYLEDHPNVREELKENPTAFMSREGSFERHEGDRDNKGEKHHKKNHKDKNHKDKDKDGDRDRDHY